jgi:two-component system, NtrC family, nitrogen regulation sensor histidine kinase NtrY
LATSGNIRFFQFILCIVFFIAAIFVQKTYSPVNSLDQTAKILERNLHKKEALIYKALGDKDSFADFKYLSESPQKALQYIQRFTSEKSIWFITLKGGRLSFWSGVKLIPDNQTITAIIREGSSIIRESNGCYEAIKKTDGDFSVIFFIPIKINYAFQNQYLQNTFSDDLIKDNNIDLTDFSDKAAYRIHSISDHYLFSVKLKSQEANSKFFLFELFFWILSIISLCTLVNTFCVYIAEKSHPVFAIVTLAVFIASLRYVNLHYNLPDFKDKLEIFSPQLYSSGILNRSLGDFCFNILLITWFVVFLYYQRNQLIKKIPGAVYSYIIFISGILILVFSSTVLLNFFYGLVLHSKISFDVTNVLNLSAFSYLCVLMLCFSFLAFYLLSEVFLTVSFLLPISNLYKALLFIIAILATTLVFSYQHNFTCFYLLWACLVFIRAYAFKYLDSKLDIGWFGLIIFVCAIISSISLSDFGAAKESVTRKAFISKLETAGDASADSIFRKIEKQIVADTSILQYFKDRTHTSDYLKTRLQKLFFNGYLSKYDLAVHEFDADGKPMSGEKKYTVDIFSDMVQYGSVKVSSYFFRENESFGFQSYHAILPIRQYGENYGTIIIELKSQPLQLSPSFPALLIDGTVKPDEAFKDYSYAFYVDDKLLSQSGDYVYDLTNTSLKGELKTNIYKTTKVKSDKWYLRFTNYSHLINKPSERNLIIVSKEENPFLYAVTSVTFFFVVFLLFSLIIVSFQWLWSRIKIFSVNNNQVKWNLRLNIGLLLYKTRIQFSMVAAVVATLIGVGIITFLSISTEYRGQQEKSIKDKINRIALAFENNPNKKYLANITEESQVDFNDLANDYSSDLTLFDLNGAELLTTQPKIYEFGLQARRINARAYINLKMLQKSEYFNNEVIGKLNYKAVYKPLRDVKNNTIAYLELPYFSNEADYRERIGALINIMINVYAIVLIAIGFFAVVIARQITSPLSFIQQSLRNTIYGKKNEPIKWARNDEIGALVAEYNKMIAELENSAQKLAQSERESAWREMAKQVAHEIKNPLTPLKLGLQLLDKSWRDKDPKFDQKFERFSKSFVEQIESLSSIASEFSAFAKMPETRLEHLNIFEIVNQAVNIFRQTDNIDILFKVPKAAFIVNADRDQLLRCFNNLLKNAIEALPPDKHGIIEITNVITGKNILLTIKDNGNGIPESLREKIFEPSFTTKSSGTGLGLSFVKNSIENAGGKVWFETEIGKGTSFYISLPTVG